MSRKVIPFAWVSQSNYELHPVSHREAISLRLFFALRLIGSLRRRFLRGRFFALFGQRAYPRPCNICYNDVFSVEYFNVVLKGKVFYLDRITNAEMADVNFDCFRERGGQT